MFPGNSVTDGVGGSRQGDSTGQGGGRSSLLGHPRGHFSRARSQNRKTARGSCRSRGRQERAHRSLGNCTDRSFPQLPPALSCFSRNQKSVTHVPGLFCYLCTRFTSLTLDLFFDEGFVGQVEQRRMELAIKP